MSASFVKQSLTLGGRLLWRAALLNAFVFTYGGNCNEMARLLDPGQPVQDMEEVVKIQCTKQISWRMFKKFPLSQVSLGIRYPENQRARTRRLKQLMTATYQWLEYFTGRPPRTGATCYVVAVSAVPRNFRFAPKCEEPRLAILCFATEQKKGEDSTSRDTFYSFAVHVIAHEIEHDFFHTILSFKKSEGEEKTVWFREGYVEHLGVRVAENIKVENPIEMPFSKQEVISYLENTKARESVYKWQGAAMEPVKTVNWAEHDFFYKASRAVIQAVETIGGDDSLKRLVLDFQDASKMKIGPDDIFMGIKNLIGVDIRDWDAFTKRYKEAAGVK